MAKKTYHTVIFGSRLSGLLAAGLMRERGASVLLLTDEDVTPRKEKGYELDMQMLPLGGIPHCNSVTGVLGKVGINLSDKKLFSPATLLFQVITDQYRLDISGKEEALKEELSLEFPGGPENFFPLMTEQGRTRKAIIEMEGMGKALFSPFGMFSKLSWKIKGKGKGQTLAGTSLFGKLSTGGLSGPFKDILSLCLEFSTPLYGEAEKLPFLNLLAGDTTGYYPKGGMSGFKSLLLSKLKKAGVHIEKVETLKSLEIENKRISKIRFEKEGVSTKSLIFNSDPVSLPPLLPQGFFAKSFRAELATKKRVGRWQSIFIGIDADKIPVGMCDAFLLAEEGNEPLFVRLTPAGEEGAVPKGKRLLKVSRPVQGEATPSDAETSGKKFEKETLGRLKNLIPFLGDGAEVIYKTGGDQASSDDALLGGPLLTPPGLGTLSPLTPFKNLFLSGREIFPVLGLEGDFLAAGMTADLVTKVLADMER